VLMGSLVVLARLYEARRFALLTSVLLAVGSGGALIGATPWRSPPKPSASAAPSSSWQPPSSRSPTCSPLLARSA
jgi:hypothetical protein